MNKRIITFLLLSGSFYLSVVYFSFFDPNPEKTTYLLSEIGSGELLLHVFPALVGTVLWFWAMYDWGARSFKRWAKITWLVLLLMTWQFAATVYFLSVGLRRRI